MITFPRRAVWMPSGFLAFALGVAPAAAQESPQPTMQDDAAPTVDLSSSAPPLVLPLAANWADIPVKELMVSSPKGDNVRVRVQTMASRSERGRAYAAMLAAATKIALEQHPRVTSVELADGDESAELEKADWVVAVGAGMTPGEPPLGKFKTFNSKGIRVRDVESEGLFIPASEVVPFDADRRAKRKEFMKRAWSHWIEEEYEWRGTPGGVGFRKIRVRVLARVSDGAGRDYSDMELAADTRDREAADALSRTWIRRILELGLRVGRFGQLIFAPPLFLVGAVAGIAAATLAPVPGTPREPLLIAGAMGGSLVGTALMMSASAVAICVVSALMALLEVFYPAAPFTTYAFVVHEHNTRLMEELGLQRRELPSEAFPLQDL